MKITKAILLLPLLLFFACAHAPNAPMPRAQDDTAGAALTSEEHMRLAAVYEAKNDLTLALKEYSLAASGSKSDPRPYFRAGNLNLKLKKYREAEYNYLKAIELDPKNASYYNNIGWAYMEEGKYDIAEGAIRTAMDKAPSSAHIYLDTLGVLQMRRERFADAERSLKDAETFAPSTDSSGLRQIYTHLYELYSRTGDKNKAREMEDRLKTIKDGDTAE